MFLLSHNKDAGCASVVALPSDHFLSNTRIIKRIIGPLPQLAGYVPFTPGLMCDYVKAPSYGSPHVCPHVCPHCGNILQ